MKEPCLIMRVPDTGHCDTYECHIVEIYIHSYVTFCTKSMTRCTFH